MAYGYRSRRFTRSRRYRRRTGRTLSTRNIYGRTGSKAQASQIGALTRQVRRINRATRPNRHVLVTAPAQHTFTNSSGDTPWLNWWYLGLNRGSNDNQRMNDKVYVRNLKWSAKVLYDTTQVGATPDLFRTAEFRLIFLQARTAARYGEGLNPSGLITNYGEAATNYDASTISPLMNGITKDYAVLFDRKYTLSGQYPMRYINLNIPLKYRTIRYAPNQDMATPDHGVVCVVVTSGLKFALTEDEQINFTVVSKMVWTE